MLALTACGTPDNAALEIISPTAQIDAPAVQTKEPIATMAAKTPDPVTPAVAVTAPATQKPAKQAVYAHVALEGCVIVRSEDSMVTYQEKCEKYGKVQPGTLTIGNQSFGTLTTSFMFAYCGNQQNIKIKNSTEYE